MVPARNVLAFVAVAAVFVAVPGPSVLFTISRALTHGRRTALLNVLGNTFGLGVQVVAVAVGLGTAVQRSSEVFTVVKLAGAVYLVYLGVQAFRHRRSLAQALASRVHVLSPLQAVRDGALVGVTNPKTIAVMVALLPQFTIRSNGQLYQQMLVVGVLFPVMALCFDSAWALAAGTLCQWLSRSPRRLAAIGGAGGLVMIGIGVSLAGTGRKS